MASENQDSSSGRLLAVTGMGMASSLGTDTRNACAAARAGIVRIQSVQLDPDVDEEFDPVVVGCHSMSPLTDGYTGVARLLRIGAFALKDLLSSVDRGASRLPTRLGIVVNLASNYYEHQGEKRVHEEMAGISHGDGSESLEESSEDMTSSPQESDTKLIDCLLEDAGIPVERARAQIIRLDQTGAVTAIETARRWLTSRTVDACIVGGIDTYAEETTLENLAALGLLKSTKSPIGLMPGEGAAFLLLEPQDVALRRGSPIHALIGPAVEAVDLIHRFAGKPPDGRTLCNVMVNALAGQSETELTFIGSLNGDNFRATEWGTALLLLQTQGITPADEIFPATYFGELGAAYGFAAICLAARSYARGYGTAGASLMWAAADSGARAALVLSRGTYTETSLGGQVIA